MSDMVGRSSDLAPLLAPPSPTQGMRFAQGVLVEWNPDDFTNIVSYRGTSLTDVPVLAGVDALSFSAGDVVGMLGWSPNGGASTWWILGRLSQGPLPEPVRIVGGDLRLAEGADLVLEDGAGVQVSDGGVVTVNGTIEVTGNINVPSGGDITVAGGDVVVSDGGGITIEDAGTLEVENASGTPQVRLGALQSEPGTFGLEQRVDGQFIPLSALAGGAIVGAANPEVFVTVGSGGDSGWTTQAGGPAVTFKTYTGRWAVFMFCTASVEGNAGAYQAHLGYQASGAQALAPDYTRSGRLTLNTGAGNGWFSMSFANVHTGPPGTLTVGMRYRVLGATSSPTSVSFLNRVLMVIPY